jgi:hypothetical protein
MLEELVKRRFLIACAAVLTTALGLTTACEDSDTAGSGSAGDGGGAGTSNGGATTSNGGAGGSGTGDCAPECEVGFLCCDGACINPANDILNCGGCGATCDQDQPFCDDGTCGSAPCDAGAPVCLATQFCCGSNCCELDQLCCVVQAGPVGPPSCYDPVGGTCPKGNPGSVCAHPNTPIATPDGERPIASLSVGDLVYTIDGEAITAVPILRVSKRAVQQHHVMRVRLDNGVELLISPLHPTADGRSVGDLRSGDTLLGPTVLSADLVPYEERFTHDILPASESGIYFTGGAVMGSTLAPAR